MIAISTITDTFLSRAKYIFFSLSFRLFIHMHLTARTDPKSQRFFCFGSQDRECLFGGRRRRYQSKAYNLLSLCSISYSFNSFESLIFYWDFWWTNYSVRRSNWTAIRRRRRNGSSDICWANIWMMHDEKWKRWIANDMNHENTSNFVKIVSASETNEKNKKTESFRQSRRWRAFFLWSANFFSLFFCTRHNFSSFYFVRPHSSRHNCFSGMHDFLCSIRSRNIFLAFISLDRFHSLSLLPPSILSFSSDSYYLSCDCFSSIHSSWLSAMLSRRLIFIECASSARHCLCLVVIAVLWCGCFCCCHFGNFCWRA